MSTAFIGMPTAPRGVGHLRGDEPFPAAARRALADAQLRRNLGKATTTIRAKRAGVVAELPDWEELREAGRAIKAGTLAELDGHLGRLEAEFTSRGGTVHWARDATEANQIVAGLVAATGAAEVVKVKSILTDEIGLNDALAAAGISAVETDLAELIVQLGRDRPSHILVPAIHRNRAEIREIFLREMRGVDPGLTDDPRALAEAARVYLRRKFLSARVGISGANFAVAQTGTLCVVESEGNGRMCLTLPETLITVMGIEKVIPGWDDLGVFLQLLPRSATGERANPYTSVWTGVTPGDGPQEVHLVLVDNGRTAALADPVGRPALSCIRCSACLNVCPVYERVGGHAYGSVYPGPIGAILSPLLTGVEDNASLPYASSLCGACYDVCPVKIDIPSILVHLRARHVEAARERSRLPDAEAAVMTAAAWAMASPTRFAAAQGGGRFGRLIGRHGRIRRLPPPLAGWTSARDAPVPPRETFRQWWQREHGNPGGPEGGDSGSPERGDPGGPEGGTPGSPEGGAWPASANDSQPADDAQADPPANRPAVMATVGRHARARGRARALPSPAANARDEVLGRIRTALGAAAPAAAVAHADTVAHAAVGTRAYRTSTGLPPAELTGLLAERLADYGSVVRRCAPGEVAASIAAALAERGARRLVVPGGLDLGELPAGVEVAVDDGLSADALDSFDGVITAAAVAIAESGTIVLDGSPGQGRRALSLIPDYHLCLVHADQVVGLVTEAIGMLAPDRPLTWISGPSATSDIELDRVQGVHGPRTLEVILIGG